MLLLTSQKGPCRLGCWARAGVHSHLSAGGGSNSAGVWSGNARWIVLACSPLPAMQTLPSRPGLLSDVSCSVVRALFASSLYSLLSGTGPFLPLHSSSPSAEATTQANVHTRSGKGTNTLHPPRRRGTIAKQRAGHNFPFLVAPPLFPITLKSFKIQINLPLPLSSAINHLSSLPSATYPSFSTIGPTCPHNTLTLSSARCFTP